MSCIWYCDLEFLSRFAGIPDLMRSHPMTLAQCPQSKELSSASFCMADVDTIQGGEAHTSICHSAT